MNNKGFGLNEMIIYSTIILVFLLIATFYVISLYSEINSDGIKKSELPTNENVVTETNSSKDSVKEELPNYLSYEQELESASFNYLEDNEMVVNNEMRLEYDNLLNSGYVSKMNDNCSGYVIVYPQDNNFSVKSYIKCDNYMTEGYE